MRNTESPVVGAPITADELRREIARYEAAYQMSTERFLVRYADSTDHMDDVEDASFWHFAYTALNRFEEDRQTEDQPPPWADDLVEERGPERALVHY